MLQELWSYTVCSIYFDGVAQMYSCNCCNLTSGPQLAVFDVKYVTNYRAVLEAGYTQGELLGVCEERVLGWLLNGSIIRFKLFNLFSNSSPQWYFWPVLRLQIHCNR